MAVNLYCPHCGQVDKVQKVSALSTQGISSTSYESPSAAVQIKDTTFIGTQQRMAFSQSSLARKLAPPTAPNIQPPKKNMGLPSKRSGVIGTLVTLVGGVGVGVAMFLIKRDSPFLGFTCPMWGILFIGISLFVSFKSFISISKGHESKDYYDIQLAAYNRKLSEHRAAKDIWDLAYYCGRCDGVFIPGSEKFTPINDIDTFIHL